MTQSFPFIQFDTPAGAIDISQEQIAACQRLAIFQAELTASVLNQMGFKPSEDPHFPAGFLLELAAVILIGSWEQQGLLELINDPELPSYAQAAKTLNDRAKRGCDEFNGPNARPLTNLIIRVWLNRCAWNAKEIFGSEMVFNCIDEEELDEKLAKYIWENRRELSKLLERKGGEK